MSVWRNNDLIITPCIHWVMNGYLRQQTLPSFDKMIPVRRQAIIYANAGLLLNGNKFNSSGRSMQLCISKLGHQCSKVWFVFGAKPLSELMLLYCYFDPEEETSLRWRHNGLDSISNHQPHDCLLNRSFGRRSKKTSKLRVTGLCVGNSPVTGEFPAQMASDAENVSIWWRHHVYHFADAGSNATIYVQ